MGNPSAMLTSSWVPLCWAGVIAFSYACSSGKNGEISGTGKAQGPAPAAPSSPSPPANGNDLSGDENTDNSSEDAESESIEEIIKQCGVKEADLENPNKVILEKQVKSFPKHLSGEQAIPILGSISYQVTITTRIKIHATIAESVQTVDFDVTGEPAQAKTKAEETVAPNKGTTTAKNLTTDERAKLITDNEQWKGIICTIQPTREIKTAKGGYTTVVKFTPPIPGSISPKADARRYGAEIGSGKTFDSTAEVTSSSDPKIAKGSRFKGRFTVKSINPELTIRVGGASGQEKKVKTDAAIKIIADFGGKEAALGLIPETTYYISHKARDLKIIVADTKDPVAGVQVLSDDL